MTEQLVIAALVVLIVAQNLFWAKIVLNLTNRLMSRSYVELKQAEQKPQVNAPTLVQDTHDPIAERQAQELNSMLGMV